MNQDSDFLHNALIASWDKPILVAWGISDKYLPQSIAEEFQNGNSAAVKLKLIEGAGHMPQEDWYVYLCLRIP